MFDNFTEADLFKLENRVKKRYANESWKLSNRDAAIIIETMNNPPKPSKAVLSMFD